MSRCRHRRRGWFRPRPSLATRRLCRDPAHGRIAGVCAGLAQYFGASRTMVRFLAITGLIFAPQLTGVAYLLAWLLLPTREELDQSDRWDAGSAAARDDLAAERARAQAFDEHLRRAPGDDLDTQRRAARQARERLQRVDERLRTLEAYVTSRRFELDREFGKL